jgi:hypothetical protein
MANGKNFSGSKVSIGTSDKSFRGKKPRLMSTVKKDSKDKK